MTTPHNGRTYVFAHGLLGFHELRMGGRPIRYFRRLEETLQDLGYAVSFPALPPTSGVDQRAQTLARHLQTIDREPLCLIGHSMGGLDARYLIRRLDPQRRVRALVSVATPHRGSPLADWALRSRWPLPRLLRAIAGPALRDLTPEACARFNAATPDRDDVQYWSYAGARALKEIPPWLRYWARLVQRQEGDNDVLVSVRSARWGTFKGILRASHFEQIGWSLAPAKPAIRRPFDHLGFYRRLLTELDTLV